MVLTPRSVWRQFVTDGVPSSGNHKPLKAEIIQLLERIMETTGAGVSRKTKALLDAVTPEAGDYPLGLVTDDATLANNGIYTWDGTDWVRDRAFPDTMSVLTDVGGTANAITASTLPGVDPAEIVSLVLQPIANSTAAVTLSVNGATAKPVMDSDGTEIAAGGLASGRITMLVDNGDEYRLLVPVDASAAAASAAASASEAQTWAEAAEATAIPDGSITTAKLADGLIVADKISNDPSEQEAILEKLGGGETFDFALLRGYISGLTLSNNAATPNTVLDVAAGVANSDAHDMMMQLDAGTIDCATVGANGLDAGALANDTWYHAFVIAQADGTTARLASTSPTAPTLPSGYTKKRRVGSFKTNGSAQIIAFKQMGNTFLWSVPEGDHLEANPGTSAVLVALSVPSGVQVEAIVWFYLVADGNSRRVALITSPEQPDTAPSAGVMSSISAGYTVNGSSQAEFRVRTNTSGQIRYRLDSSGASTAAGVVTNGWVDPL